MKVTAKTVQIFAFSLVQGYSKNRLFQCFWVFMITVEMQQVYHWIATFTMEPVAEHEATYEQLAPGLCRSVKIVTFHAYFSYSSTLIRLDHSTLLNLIKILILLQGPPGPPGRMAVPAVSVRFTQTLFPL